MLQLVFKRFFLIASRCLFFSISVAVFSACCGTCHSYNSHEWGLTHDIPPCEKPVHPIRLALVLGGGGARGMAHVGILEEFEKNQIPIDLIVGCSAGSIVGALYADCLDAEYVKSRLSPLKRDDLMDINIFYARYGLGQGHAIKKFLLSHLNNKRFEDLQIPLIVVTTDLEEGNLVVIGHGPIIPAVHASCAFPFFFTPIEAYGRMLVDGGVIDPCPVCVAKKLDACVIVAVDLCQLLPQTPPTNLFGVAKRSAEIQYFKQSESCVKDATVVIRPEGGSVDTFDDRFTGMLYESGKKAAIAAIPQIKEALRAQGILINED